MDAQFSVALCVCLSRSRAILRAGAGTTEPCNVVLGVATQQDSHLARGALPAFHLSIGVADHFALDARATAGPLDGKEKARRESALELMYSPA